MSELSAIETQAAIDQQIADEIAAENEARRVEMIAGIRALADFLETHPHVQIPYSIHGSVFASTSAEVREMTHLSGHWDKSFTDYDVAYVKTFTPPSRYSANSVRLSVSVEREQVCRKIVTGVQHVPAQTIEAHDREIVEWVCDDVNQKA